MAIDLFDFKEGLQGYRYLLLITDRWSGLVWDYYLTSRESESINPAINYFLNTLEKQYQLSPKVVECDNEFMKPIITTILTKRFIKMEPLAPNTPA